MMLLCLSRFVADLLERDEGDLRGQMEMMLQAQ